MTKQVSKRELKDIVTFDKCSYEDKCSKRGIWTRRFISRETKQVVGFYVNGKWPDGEYTRYYLIV